MTRNLDLNTLIASSREVPSDMVRGVDLNLVRDRRQHQHHWIITAAFALSDDVLERMMTNKQVVAGAVARGREIPEIDGVPLPMGQDNLLSTEGPGCIKCNAHWENPDAGYGKLCGVSDRDGEQARMQQYAALAADQQRVMERLVEHEKATLGTAFEEVSAFVETGFYDTQEEDDEGLFEYTEEELDQYAEDVQTILEDGEPSDAGLPA